MSHYIHDEEEVPHPGENSVIRIYDMKIACRHFHTWHHVGSLNKQHKKTGSHEGRGLSVSQCPEAWQCIARLGGSSQILTLSGGADFIDYHAARTKLEKLAIGYGFLIPKQRFLADHTDEDGAVCGYSIHATRKEAQDEVYDAMEHPVRVKKVLVATDTLQQRFSWHVGDVDASSYAITEMVEDGLFGPTVHGVFWNDRFDPVALSAPRAVITPRCVAQWM